MKSPAGSSASVCALCVCLVLVALSLFNVFVDVTIKAIQVLQSNCVCEDVHWSVSCFAVSSLISLGFPVFVICPQSSDWLCCCLRLFENRVFQGQCRLLS